MDYTDKIKKLLNLSKSPNEHEAKDALLKARELMARHKLSQKEFMPETLKDVKNVETPVTCSKRRNPWIMKLASVIGAHYCCEPYQSRQKKQQTYTTNFIGFEEDLEICTFVFEYAVECVSMAIQRIQRQNKGKYDANGLKRICNSYGYGFAEGIKEAFQKQQEDNEAGWGLVLSVPKEVKKMAESIVTGCVNTKIDMHDLAYQRGKKHGKEFDPNRKLPGQGKLPGK